MATYLKERANVNSLFGTYSIAENSTILNTDNLNKDSITDYILRGKDGLQRKIMTSDTTLEALSDPQKFLERKAADLNKILLEVEAVFEKQYVSELRRGLSHAETKKNTVAEVDRQLDKKLRNHKEDFPEELCKRLVKKLTG